MQINSHYPRARADCRQKSDTPLVRPQSHALHLDGLRASLDPLLVDLASQYLGPLWLPASFTLNAFAQICAKVRKWGFRNVSRVRVRARSDEPFPQQRHHLHDVQTHCATTPAPFGAIAKTSTNCTRKK